MFIYKEDEKKKFSHTDGINYIESYMGMVRNYKDWYVGITEDINERLFNFHKVDKQKAGWVFIRAESSDTARSIEKYFLDTRKTDGGPGGGDEPEFVYAYRITDYTRER